VLVRVNPFHQLGLSNLAFKNIFPTLKMESISSHPFLALLDFQAEFFLRVPLFSSAQQAYYGARIIVCTSASPGPDH
jgi:hypothetical protein